MTQKSSGTLNLLMPVFAVALAALSIAPAAYAAGEVNVYSYRQPFLIKPMLDAFTKDTGIKVNVLFAPRGLIERVKTEGKNSPADVLLTVDIGRLTKAVTEGVSQPVTSAVIEANVPAAYRAKDGSWFGLTRRSRVVYASKDRVKQEAITYEELADPKWKGKICSRSGYHVYTVALIASMIAHHGENKAEAWLTGVKNNLARKPNGNDRAQVKAIYAGECDISIGNTYYMGKMATNEKNPEQKKWADAVKILFPNTNDRGSHINISGMVMAKHAPNRANALKLMEYLASDEAQRMYAEDNFEYPAKADIPWSKMVKGWGEFKADPISIETVAKHRDAATRLVDRVGFNDGPKS